MLKKIIHTLFLPCSEATLLMEKRNAKNISPMENRKLAVHLKICKWCKAYESKLKILDEIFKMKFYQNKENIIDDIEIQDFKDKMIKKLDF